MTTFGPVYLPETAIASLDSWYDLKNEKERANYEAGIDEEQEHSDHDDDDLYSEWDRPEISEVKHIT